MQGLKENSTISKTRLRFLASAIIPTTYFTFIHFKSSNSFSDIAILVLFLKHQNKGALCNLWLVLGASH